MDVMKVLDFRLTLLFQTVYVMLERQSSSGPPLGLNFSDASDAASPFNNVSFSSLHLIFLAL